MGAYPWGFTGVTPNAERQPRRPGRVRRHGARSSPTTARCPARPSTTTRRSSAANQDAGLRRGRGHRRQLPRAAAGHRCAGRATATVDAERVRRRPVRQGHRRRAALPRHRPGATARRPCGSPSPAPTRASRAAQQRARRGARSDPRGALAAKIASRDKLAQLVAGLAARRPAAAERGRLGQAEPRRPHADRVGPADPLDQPGQAVPGAAGHGRRTRAGSAPASPTTRGSSPPTASTPRSPPWRSASSRPIEDHLRALRDISDVLNDRSGMVVARDRLRRLGLVRPRLADDRRPTAPRRTTSTPTRRSSSRAPSR